jgi:hypothetical protein
MDKQKSVSNFIFLTSSDQNLEAIVENFKSYQAKAKPSRSRFLFLNNFRVKINLYLFLLFVFKACIRQFDRNKIFKYSNRNRIKIV